LNIPVDISKKLGCYFESEVRQELDGSSGLDRSILFKQRRQIAFASV
jgi:hypothetical protein